MKIFILLLSFIPFNLFPEASFTQARDHYDQGEFEEALTSFQSIEGTSAALDFNVANTLMRLNRTAEAIAYYRRAAWQQPGDPDIRANLEKAVDRVGVEYPVLPLSRRLSGFLSARQWQMCFLLTCWFLAGVGLLTRWVKPLRNLTVWIYPLLIALTVFSGFGVWASVPSQFGKEAIVKGDSVIARFSPLSDATEHFSLPEGSLVTLKENTRKWLRVQTGEQNGWVLEDEVVQLSELP